MKAAEWIDRVKACRGWNSDYRVAKELDVGRATVSKYRSQGSTLDDDTAVKVAEALGVEPEFIILDQVAERTKSEPARAALTSLLDRLVGKARGSSGAAGDGRGRIDITSATSTGGEGAVRVPRSRQYTSHQSRPHPLQQLARALFPTASPMVAA